MKYFSKRFCCVTQIPISFVTGMTDPEKARLLLDTWETCTGSPPDLTFTTIKVTWATCRMYLYVQCTSLFWIKPKAHVSIMIKDGVHIFAHRLLLPPTSYLRSALLDNSTCCGEASQVRIFSFTLARHSLIYVVQVFIDGICSEALIAALKLLYYGECELSDVSEDQVKEAANVLGFRFSKDNSVQPSPSWYRVSQIFHPFSHMAPCPYGGGGVTFSFPKNTISGPLCVFFEKMQLKYKHF